MGESESNINTKTSRSNGAGQLPSPSRNDGTSTAPTVHAVVDVDATPAISVNNSDTDDAKASSPPTDTVITTNLLDSSMANDETSTLTAENCSSCSKQEELIGGEIDDKLNDETQKTFPQRVSQSPI